MTGNLQSENGTELEGGIYHGRIQFTIEYPQKSPIFTFLTETGRFKTHTDISFCQICWPVFGGVRNALLRHIDALPTYADGALGSVEYDKEERRALAIKSREAGPTYGTAERQKLIDKIHKYMLSKAPPLPSNMGGDIQASYQIDVDKRMPGIHILVGNKINANNCELVGIFDFENNCCKEAKQVVSSRASSSTSKEDNQE